MKDSIITWGIMLLVAAASPALAQQDTSKVQRVELEADSLIGLTIAGEPVRRLVGDVRLRQGTTRLRASEATQYIAREEILFTGNVRIIDQGDSLWADRVRYDTRRKIGEARGDVHLSDGAVNVFAPSAEYFVDEKRAEFRNSLRLIDSLTVLTSRTGIYWSERAEALFFDSVRVEDPEAVITADTVFYQRETRVSRARGDVMIVRSDTTDDVRTFAFAERAFYDPANDYSRLEGHPLVMQLRRDTSAVDTLSESAPSNAEVGTPRRGVRSGALDERTLPGNEITYTDTLLVRARRLEWTRRDSLHRLVAIDSVRLWQTELAAVADSAVFERYVDSTGQVLRQRLRLFEDPLAWSSNTQITGDTLRFIRHPGTPDSLFAFSDAFVARHDTSLGHIQQLQGERVLVVFQNDSLRSLEAGPQAEAIYYLAEDDRSNGAVRVSGDRIFFAFEGGEVERVRVLRGVQGRRFPEDQLPEPFQLLDYVWEPEMRPTKASLLVHSRWWIVDSWP